MKIKNLVFSKALLLVCVLFMLATPCYSQLIELNTQQSFGINSPGFFPFSDEANETIKELLVENSSVAVIITTFSGKGLKIAPAADNRETGRKKKVNPKLEKNVLVLEYKKKKANKFGLSFVPHGGASFSIEVQPFARRPCSEPVNCQDNCGENLGKCCEQDSNGNQAGICIQVGHSSCSCTKR